MLRKQGCLFLVYQIFGLKSDLLNWLLFGVLANT